MVRKIDKNSYDIIGLNVYDDNDDNIKEGMLYMSKSDFNLRIRKRIIDKETEHVYNKNTSLRRNLVQAANWKSVKVGSNVDVWKTVKIQWSIDLQKDADSPTNGQYRSYHKAIIEAETTDSMYKIKEMYIYQDGGGKTKVYNYDPKPSTQNLGQVTFSLPWGVSYTYDLGSSVKIEKNAGGIGSSYVELRFINSIHTRVLNGIVATEQFQTGTSYYSSGIRYIVKIKKDEGFPKVDDYATANASHYVGGY
ncbi:hypothetical protein PL321_11405 [Caloramator sp. mosi_1]|uniref:hypothetical protein n=1 Tax=Caloramator sp. mosi_1 TaxID=3023090 RepID=UPI00235ED5FB|nr:hypothetical protein [Caloramator sp. mosi_1]WDC83362.1 hypothetical protein PL321_11405 [Caloramator sp. mosi_1]